MKINNWIKSEYVMFIGIALLSFVWRVCPSEKNQRVSRPASVSLFIYYHFLQINRTTGLASGSDFTKLVNISKLFFIMKFPSYYFITILTIFFGT